MSSEQLPPSPAANDEQSALANLKALLLGPEQSTIKRLQQEAGDPELQTQRVAENLPESLDRAYRDAPAALTRALEAPVSECIEDSVQHNPTLFADILYPVMGPAIRRSISQALKGLVQQINQTLEHSLTLTGLKWRIEAARSGVPFGEIVLRNTLRYRVEEAFLIQTGSGLLIQHLSQGPAPAQDADAVSAMLTAIRDFAHDTMDRNGEDSKLETVDIGEHTLWLVHGPKAYLACAIRGLPPIDLREDLADILEEIHRRHGRALEAFDGDPAQTAAVTPLLETCLRSEMAESSVRRFPWPLALILLILLGALGWSGYTAWLQHRHAAQRAAVQHAAVALMAAAPGIVLTDWHIKDGRLRLRGLHDPLTPTPRELLGNAGIPAGEVEVDFRTYQSAEPRAALARATQRLTPPDSVSLSIDQQGTLMASGIASAQWIARARLLATTVPGIDRLDDRRLENIDLTLQRQLRDLLRPPAGVTIEVRDGIAEISGEAPLAWIGALEAAWPKPAGLTGLRHDRLVATEAGRLDELARMIENSRIEFPTGIDLVQSQLDKIAALAALIDEARQYAQQLDRDMRLEIIGRTDGTGSPEQNYFVARERAQRVAQALRDTGLGMPTFTLHTVTQPPDRSEPDADLRRVEFRVAGLVKSNGKAVRPP